jgi:hypothetical protein
MATRPIQIALPGAPLSRVLELIRTPLGAVRTAVENEPVRDRRPAAPALRGTPEIYFTKPIDNSRLVKVADPQRQREMVQFAVACAVLLMLAVLYAWQHFSAIEYGYRIEAQKAQCDSLMEVNRQLRLEQAALRDPERIDLLARRLGLVPPDAGQMLRMDRDPVDAGAPVLASVAPIPGGTAR